MNHKKRTLPRYWIELAASLVLAYGVYSQRSIIGDSLRTLRHADVFLLILCFSLTWLLFLFSASSYRLLSPKPVKIPEIMLAHLAAAGPGRIIPGGAGQMSFGTLYLTKKGLKLPAAIAVAVSNNLIGFCTNIVLLAFVYLRDPTLLDAAKISSHTLLVLAALGVFAGAVVLFARRSTRIKKGTDGASKELKSIFKKLRKQPIRGAAVVTLMLATTFMNSFLLYLAAHAVGLNVSLSSALVAMSTGVALGGLVPTPGGVGGVEAGLVASMYALGFDIELATSAALLYRFTTYALPFVPGIGAYIYLRRRALL